MIKSILHSLVRVTLLLAVVTSSAFVIPRYHEAWLRNYVGTRVVKLVMGRSGGTGVHIEAPSGDTYIASNGHVCALGAKSGYLNVDMGGGVLLPRAIIKISVHTDLCLIEPIPGVRGLKLADDAPIGTEVTVIGHPKLMPLTKTKGELIGAEWVDVMDHIIDPTDEKDTCDMPKNKKAMMNFFFMPVPVCLLSIEAYLSNIVILPGSSGSPLVNDWGQLIGLAFASDNDVHWALFVPLAEIKDFIQTN